MSSSRRHPASLVARPRRHRLARGRLRRRSAASGSVPPSNPPVVDRRRASRPRRASRRRSSSSGSASSRASSSRSSTSPSRTATTPTPASTSSSRTRSTRTSSRSSARARSTSGSATGPASSRPPARASRSSTSRRSTGSSRTSCSPRPRPGSRKAADLKGKKIGTPGRYGSGWVMLQALLASAGLTTDDVEIVEYPDFTQEIAVEQGAVDAATGFANNEPVQLELHGEKAVVLHVDGVTPLPGPGPDRVDQDDRGQARRDRGLRRGDAPGDERDQGRPGGRSRGGDRGRARAGVVAGRPGGDPGRDDRVVDRADPGGPRARRDRPRRLDVVDHVHDRARDGQGAGHDRRARARGPAAGGRTDTTRGAGGGDRRRVRASIREIGYDWWPAATPVSGTRVIPPVQESV